MLPSKYSNAMNLKQNDHYFANISSEFLQKKEWYAFNTISLIFVPGIPFDKRSALVQVLIQYRTRHRQDQCWPYMSHVVLLSQNELMEISFNIFRSVSSSPPSTAYMR